MGVMKISAKEVAKLKLALGSEVTEENDKNLTRLLAIYLEDARAFILAYTGRSERMWLKAMDGFAREIALIAYSARGDEGAASKREGAFSVSYIRDGDLPKRIIRGLKPFRVVR